MVAEKRISRMKRTFFIDNVKNMYYQYCKQWVEQAPLSKVIALCDVLYNWKTIFLIKHVNFKLPKHGNKGNNWE